MYGKVERIVFEGVIKRVTIRMAYLDASVWEVSKGAYSVRVSSPINHYCSRTAKPLGEALSVARKKMREFAAEMRAELEFIERHIKEAEATGLTTENEDPLLVEWRDA